MRLSTAALMAGICLPCTVAIADDAPAPLPRAGRFTMVPADGGFVRLDTETGIVSHCRREGEGGTAEWHCAAIPEDMLSAPDRMTVLKTEVDELRKQVADLDSRLAKLAEAASRANAAKIDAPKTVTPLQPQIDRDSDLDFGEELLRRFFGLIREMKRANRAAGP